VDDRSRIEYELRQLRAEIATILKFPALSPEFVTWLGKLFALVQASFGSNSDEMRQLREISPELPSEFYDSVADRLVSLGSNGKQASELLSRLYQDTPQTIFRRRMYDYDDLIAAMIINLQN
jgi:hypothetical protein